MARTIVTSSFPDPGLLRVVDQICREQRINRSEFFRAALEQATGYESQHVPYTREERN
ncbi:ribbon-helix-helix protein, CopG family [Pseudonocardia sp. WMMC193]|uniref:ribbon-helix-helix protein, CopG family n=1 Tax=Pseudonocardia sp. WMMC193 TaxID=2911965 RepID=UPI001EFFA58C|nr:ribbon-helix-helix protein, CopG family [Pseudonocardia sp. WMMC193]MCF7548171.1 ribbon-helix-helix protein, CopG family [Pseudonocardia sp. WMMC193]